MTTSAKQKQIDFYQLSSNSSRPATLFFVCKLIEKVYLKQHQLYVYCQDQTQASELDELLWTYQDISFIPHNLINEGPNEPPPIQLAWPALNTQAKHRDILLNLATDIPNNYEKFRRILTVIFPSNIDPENTNAYQTQLTQYQQNHFIINTHQIDAEKTYTNRNKS